MAAEQAPNEKTFRAYTQSDAEKYAQHRQQYSDALYQSIFTHHASTGGKFDTAVDVGCGPGIATFKLAETFKTTIGLDPSEGMITAARSLAKEKAPKGSATVRFEVSTAEDISADLIPDGSVDLITAATSAHYFHLPTFYPTAARLLAPHGTLALFTARQNGLHPATPNAAAINTALRALEAAELRPFFAQGNLFARDAYATLLPLPWTTAPPEPAFPERLFVRKTFGRMGGDGAAEAEGVGKGEAELEGQGEDFYHQQGSAERWWDLGMVEEMLATASPVARWREANPGKVGTEEDVVKRITRTIETLLWEAGVEKGKERVRLEMGGVLLMFKA